MAKFKVNDIVKLKENSLEGIKGGGRFKVLEITPARDTLNIPVLYGLGLIGEDWKGPASEMPQGNIMVMSATDLEFV